MQYSLFNFKWLAPAGVLQEKKIADSVERPGQPVILSRVEESNKNSVITNLPEADVVTGMATDTYNPLEGILFRFKLFHSYR